MTETRHTITADEKIAELRQAIAELRAGIEERNRAIDSINAQRNAAEKERDELRLQIGMLNSFLAKSEKQCAVLEETVAWQTARARAAEKALAARVVKKERPPLVIEDDIQPEDDPSIPFTGQPRHAISDFEKENTDAEDR